MLRQISATAMAPTPITARSRRCAYSGSASAGQGTRRVETTEAPISSRPRPTNGRTTSTALETAGSDSAMTRVGAAFRSSVARVRAVGEVRLRLRTAGVLERTGREVLRRTARGSRRTLGTESRRGRRRGRVAAAGTSVFRVTALGRVGGDGAGAGGATVLCGLDCRSARLGAGGGGGGGGGGGVGRARGFGRLGFGSGIGEGCGSGLGAGVVAVVAVVVCVVSVTANGSEASPASACEDAKPKRQVARRTVASLMWRRHRGAAAAARLMEPRRPSSDSWAHRPEARHPAV